MSNEDLYKIKDFVIIKMKKNFPGIIHNTNANIVLANVMKMSSSNKWKWPDTDDELWYVYDGIMEVIKLPKS